MHGNTKFLSEMGSVLCIGEFTAQDNGGRGLLKVGEDY